MGFGDAIRSGFASMTNFDGRAKRAEFWYWVLFIYIIQVIVYFVFSAMGRSDGGFLTFIWYLVGIILWLATIAVGCRRLHDTGKSGWLQLLAILPCVGFIILIIFWAQPSQAGDNTHGPATA